MKKNPVLKRLSIKQRLIYLNVSMNKSTNLQNNQTTKVKYALYTFKYSRKNNIITYSIIENMHAQY